MHELADAYQRIRRTTESLVSPLSREDYVLQAMDDVSPPKWHLAHTTWFYETFVLIPFVEGYQPFHERYGYLFNSYYEGVGAQFSRPRRGLLSRPTTDEILAYRRHIDAALLELLGATAGIQHSPAIDERVQIGLHHEQQHQELLLVDILYNFSANPLRPAYRDDLPIKSDAGARLEWIDVPGGIYEIGAPDAGFAYDNERPRHRVLLSDFQLANRPVINIEWQEFMADGGYRRPELWLSDGWSRVKAAGWKAPLYWELVDGVWHRFTLGGMRPIDPLAPVCHVSYYEADAFARWAGKRLPSEAEWEVVASARDVAGLFLEEGSLDPRPAGGTGGVEQLFGDVWELTASPYAAYPGYRPLEGALGEYNGKFMCNQIVLRGGSCLTPEAHMRASYRNFYYPHQRWNRQGLRLAA